MADRLGRPGHLGHQKLRKEDLAGPSVSGHHQEWGRHALRHHFIYRFRNFSLNYCSWKSRFLALFVIF
jgi:hypothetical protein